MQYKASPFFSFLSNQFSSILTSRRQLVQRNQFQIPQGSLSHPSNGIKHLNAFESIQDPKFLLRVSMRNPRVHLPIRSIRGEPLYMFLARRPRIRLFHHQYCILPSIFVTLVSEPCSLHIDGSEEGFSSMNGLQN